MNCHESRPNARGKLVLSQQRLTECELYAWVDQEYKLKHRITRTLIFRQALRIDKKHLGGAGSRDHMSRMKDWFYHGFCTRYRLSNRKISGAGQKLPDGWQAEHEKIKARVKLRCVQHEHEYEDGVTRTVQGVMDENYCNSDHVPTWIEPVGNYSWGDKDSERRSIGTAGKEKDRFTTQ
jgi:hypothetical protein